MSPAPITRTESAAATGARETACSATVERLRERGLHHRHPGRQPVDDARRDRDPLRERPVPPPLALRDAQDAAVVAQVGHARRAKAQCPQ